MSEDRSSNIEELRKHVLAHEAHGFVTETPQSAKIKGWEQEAEKVLSQEKSRTTPDERKIEQTEAVISLLSIQYAALRKGRDPLVDMTSIHPRINEWLVEVGKLPDLRSATRNNATKVIDTFIGQRGAFAAEVDRFRIMNEDPAAEFVTLTGTQLKIMRSKQEILMENLDKMSKGQAGGLFNIEMLHDRMVWDLKDLEEKIDEAEAVQSGISLYLADKYTNSDGPGFEHPHKKVWITNLQTLVQETVGVDEKQKVKRLNEFIEKNGKIAKEIDEAHSKWEHALEVN